MAPETEFFPHEGEHLANDDKQARWTLLFIGIFAALAIMLIVIGLRGL